MRKRIPVNDAFKKNRQFIKTGNLGVLSTTANGFGFVSVKGEEDVFIPAKYIEDAIDGDEVNFAIIPEKELAERFAGKGRTGRILNVVNRKRRVIVGQLINKDTVIALSKKITQNIYVTQGATKVKRGEWVVVELSQPNQGRRGLRGKIIKMLGEVGSITADLDAVTLEYSIPPPYTAAEERQSTTIEPHEVEREDYKSVFCVTIDPTDAKDHDDAMSIDVDKKTSNIILGVHIADVACYVKSGSKWDKEAKKRAFTAYLPGRTLPMLPKTLTKNMSLSPNKESFAHSVFFIMHPKTAEILSVRRAHTVIDIKHSMNYDEVQSFIDTKKAPKIWDKQTKSNMKMMIDITRKMRRRREKEEAFLEMSIPEFRVIVDEEKQVVQTIERRIQRESEMMVEECMLAANTAIAKLMQEKKIASLYRVHDDPTPEKIEQFTVLMHNAFGINVGDISTREGCNDFILNLQDDENKPAILQQFLRAMARAEYRVEKSPHFGLGKSDYLHFTSPIRRYTDLLVHRQLLAIDRVEKLSSKVSMGELAEYCTQKEQQIDDASYAANDRMKLHYLQHQLEHHGVTQYDAIVTRITNSGNSIEIPVIGLYGFMEKDCLYIRKKHGKKEEYVELQQRVGEKFKAQLLGIDFLKGIAYFAPTETL